MRSLYASHPSPGPGPKAGGGAVQGPQAAEGPRAPSPAGCRPAATARLAAARLLPPGLGGLALGLQHGQVLDAADLDRAGVVAAALADLEPAGKPGEREVHRDVDDGHQQQALQERGWLDLADELPAPEQLLV